MIRSSRNVTMVLIGRTGVGKSTLANKIAKRDNLFEEGHNLVSQTDSVTSYTFPWPDDTCTEVKIVDTPGLADNRPEMTNAQLLSKVLDFVKNLEDGLHIVLFCLNAKTRVDAHDTQELEMLGMLLGEKLFDHVYIVVTQGNTLIPDQKEKIYKNFKNDLPRILIQHNLPLFPEEKILFADFDSFDEFLAPLTKTIQSAKLYKPEIAEGVDPDDPESISRFLQTPEMKKIMEKYEQLSEQQRKQILAMEEELKKKSNEMKKIMEDSQEEQRRLQQNYEAVNQALKTREFENQAMKKQYEDYRDNQREQLTSVNAALESLKQQNNFYQTQLTSRQGQIDQLNNRIDELRKERHQQPKVIHRRRRSTCNLI